MAGTASKSTKDMFAANVDYQKNAYLDRVTDAAALWGLHADGFKLAVEVLVEQAGTFYERNVLVYPIAFSYRHYIELKLKEIIASHGMKPPITHSLAHLWAVCKTAILERALPVSPQAQNRVDDLIRFWNFDPMAATFRYPFDVQGARSLPSNKTAVDLDYLMVEFAELDRSLTEIGNLVDADEDMKREYERDQEREFWYDMYGGI